VHDEKLHDLCSLPDVVRAIKSRRMLRTVHVKINNMKRIT
jgi:hypothetical protein